MQTALPVCAFQTALLHMTAYMVIIYLFFGWAKLIFLEAEPMSQPISTLGIKSMDNNPDYTSSMPGFPGYYKGIDHDPLEQMGGFDADTVFLPAGSNNAFLIQIQQTNFRCDNAPFTEPWMFASLQPSLLQTQPHRQEMVYPQPPFNGYTRLNQPYMVMGGTVGGYPQPTFTDSGFQDSDTSHSYQKIETEPDSDSSQSSGSPSAAENAGPIRRGPFKNLRDRAQTAQTRKDGSCLRCRAQKIRVCRTQNPEQFCNLLTNSVCPGSG